MKKTAKLKKFTAYVLLFCMILDTFIFNIPNAQAAQDATEKTSRVILTKIYTGFRATEKRIEIEDYKIEDYQEKQLKVRTDEKWEDVKNKETIGKTIIQAELSPNWVITEALIQGKVEEGDPPKEKNEQVQYKNINEKGIPEILNVDTPVVKANESIVLNGKERIGELSTGGYIITVGGVEADVDTNNVGENQVKLTPKSGEQFPRGIKDIVIRKEDDSSGYTLQTVLVYKGAVRIIGELGIEGVAMFPSMGEPGSKVQFSRDTFPNIEGYDIYFIKDLNNLEFKSENMGKNFNMRLPQSQKEDSVITIEVPDINSGPYYIVFTNKNSQDIGVDSMYVLPQKFQVVRVSQNPTIESVQPNKASARAETKVEIKGNFFIKHNIPGFNPDNSKLTEEKIKVNDEDIKIDYGQGKLNLPDENGEIKQYDVDVKRKIEVDIGRVLPIEEFKYDLENKSDPDSFSVKTEVFTLEKSKTENVVVRMITEISGEFEAQMVKEVTIPNGFLYYPSTEKPEVDKVIPEIIPIEEKDNKKFYLESSMERLLVSVEGDRFLVTRYVDENGEEKVSYPKVTIGGVVINPDAEEGSGEYKPLKYEVFKDGQIVSGTPENEIGNRILIELKAGEKGFEIKNKDSRNVHIKNPIRKSKDYADTDWIFTEKVKFQLVNKNDFPVIEKVKPSLVSIDGGEDILITGSNFRPGAKVYIENKVVSGVNITGDGRKITFKAPEGSRPGETLLQVVNPEGGIATHVFTYTKTYTQPKLIDINPKEGTTKTLVTAKGENFLPPDPTIVINDIDEIDEGLIYRLVGTRILMNGHDINEYNRGEQDKIELRPFFGDNIQDNIFKYNEDEKAVELGDSFDSVILFNEKNKKFYRIYRDVRNEYFIESGESKSYKIYYDEDEKKFKSNSGGNTSDISFPQKGEIKIGELNLKAYTPFLMKEVKNHQEIVGNRVRFVDSNTLNFRVPLLSSSPWTGEGYYDVTVENPDTKKDTLDEAFYYFASSSTRPIIEDIVPDRGPYRGGNVVKLIGPKPNLKDENDKKIGFIDNGKEKTKVFIGSQMVPEENVVVSPNGRQITLRVPPTVENIKGKGTDRIVVPVVVVNPDGGTFSISYGNPLEVKRANGEKEINKVIRGYTYVIPTSNPKISDIFPKEQLASGGFIVEIFGSDFRDFEPFVDTVGDGKYQKGMPFDDIDGNGVYTDKAPKDKETSNYNSKYEYLTSPLYPKVYFGEKEAEVVEFGSGYLQVITPPSEIGNSEVYVVNNDSGISNTVTFNCLPSHPTITNVVPNVGMKTGGESIDIHGSDFETSKVTLLTEEKLEKQEMPLVRFGERTNKNVPREDANGGVIRSGIATVKLDGEVNVKFNANKAELEVSLTQNKKTYKHKYEEYQGEQVFINTKDLINDSNEHYPYEELIKVEVKQNRLLVEGGFAPEAEYRNNKLISAKTPYYYTIGQVSMNVINPDGAEAEAGFEYKNPDSTPVITNITKEGNDPIEEHREEIDGDAKIVKVNYKGGNIIGVHGTDFREKATIQISNILTINKSQIDYELPNKLTFTMPPVPESEVGKLYRVVVLNKDGGSACSDTLNPPIYIEIIKGESNPKVTGLEPKTGSCEGGTRVKIVGEDFREKMEGFEEGKLKVYFGEKQVPQSDIQYIDYKTLIVKAPKSNKQGEVSVRVENPDGSLSLSDQKFNYISKPKITSTNPRKLFTNDTKTEVTIVGKMFMSGAKVIVGGKIIPKEDLKKDMNVLAEGISGVDYSGKNKEVVVVGGQEAASVEVESEYSMKVKFNEGKDLENTDLIIVNPDGGISEPFDDFQYEIPVPNKPLVLEGIPGYESTVQLIWSKSDEDLLNKATKYEVYGKLKKDEDFTYIGDTEEAQYLIKGLEVNEDYIFMVRALNEYGSAIDFAQVKVRTLNIRQDEKLREKQERLEKEEKKLRTQGKEEIIGSKVIKTLGTNEITGRTCTVDFSLSKYNKCNQFTLAIPLKTARKDANITIKDGIFTFTFNPRDLYTFEVSRKDNGNSDSYVRVHFDRTNETYIRRTKKPSSKAYNLYFDYQYGKQNMKINSLLRPGQLSIRHDGLMYPNRKNIYIAKFVPSKAQYIFLNNNNLTNIKEGGKYILLSNR